MRKEIVGHERGAVKTHDCGDWLDLESIASVQLTSEDPAFPIENALACNPEGNEKGWRAASAGPQTISLSFDHPQRIRRIYLLFIEHQAQRSQEFLLRYSSPQQPAREILRQQWVFSPTGSSQETEDYTVELDSVTKLELVIDPDRGKNEALAALNILRLA
jgi:hypothetical protein